MRLQHSGVFRRSGRPVECTALSSTASGGRHAAAALEELRADFPQSERLKERIDGLAGAR